jgi:hypothetical protein
MEIITQPVAQKVSIAGVSIQEAPGTKQRNDWGDCCKFNQLLKPVTSA